MCLQPFGKRLLRGVRLFACQCTQCARELPLVPGRQVPESPKSGQEMQWCRQPPGREPVDSPIGRDEIQALLSPKEVGKPHLIRESGQVRAASHADVLAIVDHFAGRRIDKRSRAAPESRSRFEQRDFQASLGESAGSSQSRQSPADNDRMSLH